MPNKCALFLIAIASLLALARAAGWAIDTDSCTDATLRQQIKDTMDWVFGAANDALTELNKDPWDDDPDKKNPKGFERDDDTQNPFSLAPVDKGDGSGEKEDPKKMLDGIRSLNPWAGNKDMSRTKAWTWSYAQRDALDENWEYAASQISIAPFKTWRNRKREKQDEWKLRDVDKEADFKVTMFHEMVHTRPVAYALGLEGTRSTDDRLGYAWNNIRNGPTSDVNTQPAVYNADSYAYFALIISFMKNGDPAYTIDKYGTWQAMAQALQRLLKKFIRWVA
ncbi:MAG: hypothetical protein Q9227_002000 [Pyrenula ochraceoflavens]